MQQQQAALVTDLTQCDREPIQIPGNIQPHGVLLVLQEPNFVILQVSATTQAVLGVSPESLLHASLDVLLDADQMVSFRTSLTRTALENNPLYLFTMKLKGQEHLFDGIAHRNNGEEILDFLYQRNAYANPGTSMIPSLILLDLNLIGLDGRVVLSRIKSDPGLKHIPVVIITTSSSHREIDFCYREGASGYLLKPVNLDHYAAALNNLLHYWFETVQLPETKK